MENKIPQPSDVRVNRICDFNYLNDAMGHKGYLIKDIMEIFLKQIPEELNAMNQAIIEIDYPTIKNFAHTMKSSVSVMDIKSLIEILNEMESLGSRGTGIEQLTELNNKLNEVCGLALEEVTIEKSKYV